MAIFGLDLYGLSKYGSRSLIDYGVDPFRAQVSGFNTVNLTWSHPSGDWGGFRLLRNRLGYPTTQDDGTVLIDIPPGFTGGALPLSFSDQGMGGGWSYYSIFLFNTPRDTWERASVTDTLVPFDYGSTDKLWDLLPEYYKQVRDNAAGISQTQYQINPAIYLSNEQQVPNEQLIKFLQVFGWAFDILRTQAETTLDGYDVDHMHPNRLALLADQFGSHTEPSATPGANRSLVRNLGLLYRKRGTRDGLRELLSLLTGWDVSVDYGPNLMLNEDQSDFVSPRIPYWDPTVKYAVGDRVRYGMNLFQAIDTAYGANQAPPSSRTSNARWDVDQFIEPKKDRTIARSDTGDISTWQIVGPSGPVSGQTFIGMGAVDPTDPSSYSANSLAFRNETATDPADFVVRSIPLHKDDLTQFNKRLVIESGIPVPRATKRWNSTTVYYPGDLVLYRGAAYEAIEVSEGVLPSVTSDWKRVGYDDRTRLSMSMYTHGPFNGTVGTGGNQVYPHLLEFDENGDLIQEITVNPVHFMNLFFDPFNTVGLAAAAGGSWTAGESSWEQGWDDAGGYLYPAASVRATLLTPVLTSDGNVGVTFRGVGSRQVGVMFRRSNASNFWMATQTGLYKVVDGADPASPASGAVTWTPCEAGDRLTVNFVDDAITVKKNGVVVGTATDSFNQNVNRHGIVVNA